MYRAIFVNAAQPVTEALSQLTTAFVDAGWSVVEQGDYHAVVASQVRNGKQLLVKWRVDESDAPSSEPTGNFRWGLLVSVARKPDDWSPEFASTIFHGGQYDVIIAPHSFVILPPETQTHRFAYGTWCALLEPMHQFFGGDYIPFAFLGDRTLGAFERAFPHATVSSAPVYYINTASGEVTNAFAVAHVSVGRKVLLQRERFDYIAPVILLMVVGGALHMAYIAPDWFVEVTPRQPVYIPTHQSYAMGDFLVPRVVYGGVRVLPCGLLPPDGAKLLSVF